MCHSDDRFELGRTRHINCWVAEDVSVAEGALTNKEKFDVARELIRHEDGLVNNRVTWLLVFQGFLFTAFVNGIKLYDQAKCRPWTAACVTIGLVLIGLLGIASSLTALNVVRIAFEQMDQVKTWWKWTGHAADFPPLAGKLGKGWFYVAFSTGRMPFVLAGVWLVLIVLLLIGVR